MNANRLAPLPPVVAAAAPVAPPTPADRPPVRGAPAHPFAELLRQNRRAEANPAPPATAESQRASLRSADASSGDAADLAAEVASGAPKRNEATQARARAAGAAKAVARPGATTPHTGSDPEDVRSSDPKDPTASPAGPADPASSVVHARRAEAARPPAAPADETSPSGNAALAVSHRRSVDPGAGAEVGDRDATDAGADAGGATNRNASRAGTSRIGASRADGPRMDASRAGAAGRETALSAGDASADGSVSTRGPFAEALAGHGRANAAPSSTGLDGAAPTASAASTLQADPLADVAPASAAIPLPIDAPEFPAAIAVQVSLFAKDGVQHAELHLNPAEMGPVSIAIAIDGTNARVDFGADVAATRRALEAGLPELAGALRDAGFTLTGGGVSQQTQTGGNPSRDGARAADRVGRKDSLEGAATAAVEPAGARTTRRIVAGGIDLYA